MSSFSNRLCSPSMERHRMTIILWFLLHVLLSVLSARVTLPGCGESLDSQSRIIGGAPVEEGFLPWMVTLHAKLDLNFHHICGGSILNGRWILTAAHCIDHPDRPDLYELYVGLHHLSRKSAKRVKRHLIAKFFVHEGYSNASAEYDIALVKTKDKIDFSGSEGYVNGVCLPFPGQRAPTSGTAVVAGWGHTQEEGETSDVLRKAHVPLVPRYFCNKVYDSDNTRIRSKISKTMLCAGSVGLDSCQADSGGPLLLWKKGRAYQFGIVSFGDGCGRKGFPGVYTRVSSYIKWIENKVHRH